MSKIKTPKRKRYPKLPNGYGSIKWLGNGRRNPYGVYPPVTDFTDDGIPISGKALCYTDDWMKGFAVLTAYKAGTYTPGMELELASSASKPDNADCIVQKLLSDYNRLIRNQEPSAPKKTFAQIYEEFFYDKYERNQNKKYSASSMASTRAAFKNSSVLHERIFSDLRYPDLQAVIDNCPLKHSSLELIANLFRQMYSYAIKVEEIDRNYAEYVQITKEEDDDHGVPYSDKDLKRLWNLKSDPIAEFLLIMCYSGHRISEYKTLTVDLNAGYFQGGIKTKAGRNRIVPIHSAILPLVKKRIAEYGELLPMTPHCFRTQMDLFSQKYGFERHTPHDCRHTFSKLCEQYCVAENDRKRMLGHAFGDVTNDVYGHRGLEDLRTEIEKIKVN